jgi:antibiotic biosynthesis monooxygenase (ABM) superfamily enzyme
MSDSATRTKPFARFRFLAVAMLGAYLSLNLLLALLSPVTAQWPTVAVTALAVPPMVLAMVYLIIPLARRA